MTLVAAVEGEDPGNGGKFLIIGSDSRGHLEGLEGAIAVDRMEKIHTIADHVGILAYGKGELCLDLIDEFKIRCSSTDEAYPVAKEFCNCSREIWNEWFRGVPIIHRPPDVGFIIAGLNKIGDNFEQPKIYEVRSSTNFAIGAHKHGFAIGGVTFLGNYILNKKYKRGMPRAELAPLVAYAIHETSSVNMYVGGEIKMGIVDNNGLNFFEKSDIDQFIEEGLDKYG